MAKWLEKSSKLEWEERVLRLILPIFHSVDEVDLNSKKLATAALAGGIGGLFSLTGEAVTQSAVKGTIDNLPGRWPGACILASLTISPFTH